MSKTADNKDGNPIPPKEKVLYEYISIFALGLIAVFVSYIFWKLITPRKDFYNELWGPAYLLVHGNSPYNTSSLTPSLPAAWFPMAIGFFFPLGWIPENLAMYVWFILNLFEIWLLIYFVQGRNRSVYNTIILALLCFLFPPTINHFNLGQISLTVTLCLFLAAYFVDKDHVWSSAFFVALAFSKPHLAILSGFGLSYYYGSIKTSEMISFLLRTLVIALVLCIPLFISYPAWIPDAIASMASNPPWTHPSLFILFQKYLGLWGYVVWGLVVMFVLWLCYFLWKKLPPENAMCWSIALAPIVTPYIGSWDFVVLLPLLICTFSEVTLKKKIFLMILYGIAWFGMAFLQLQPNSHDFHFWWIPLWFMGGIAFVTDWKITLKSSAVI